MSGWSYGRYPWVPMGSLNVIPNYKKGDIVELNKFGITMLAPSHPSVVKVGIVMSNPYDIFYPNKGEDENYVEYWGYDVLFGNQLITMIPEDFIEKVVIKDEKSNEKLEEVLDGEPIREATDQTTKE